MRRNLLQVLSSVTIALLLSAFTYAQDSRVLSAAGDIYVISAKAGGVNFIEGKVSVARKQGRSGLLLKGDKVEIGDKVLTGADGKAEILLNPGSYLRLSENSTFEFVSTELENLQIKLKSGSAIFEVFADNEFRVAIDTPKTNFYLIQSGIYRIDVSPDGTEKIEVWRGRAQIGRTEANIIKGGKAAVIKNGQPQIEKFDRDEKDGFELWSKTRAKDLAKINAKLERSLMKTSLISSYNQRSWNMYDSFGVWVYNSSYGANCFLPFGYGWRSPYGYGFGYSFYDYRLPSYIYNQPLNPSVTTPGSNNIPTAASQEIARPPRAVPPFARVRSIETREPINNDIYDQRSPTRSVSPSTITPSEPAAAPSQNGAKVRDN
ncbi:MAG: FecR domain-containing protein [Pyrinomonadaceae bacterium]|nr:FecR domain-containing protein [Pyrinomonadaceae bacterium]